MLRVVYLQHILMNTLKWFTICNKLNTFVSTPKCTPKCISIYVPGDLYLEHYFVVFFINKLTLIN